MTGAATQHGAAVYVTLSAVATAVLLSYPWDASDTTAHDSITAEHAALLRAQGGQNQMQETRCLQHQQSMQCQQTHRLHRQGLYMMIPLMHRTQCVQQDYMYSSWCSLKAGTHNSSHFLHTVHTASQQQPPHCTCCAHTLQHGSGAACCVLPIPTAGCQPTADSSSQAGGWVLLEAFCRTAARSPQLHAETPRPAAQHCRHIQSLVPEPYVQGAIST